MGVMSPPKYHQCFSEPICIIINVAFARLDGHGWQEVEAAAADLVTDVFLWLRIDMPDTWLIRQRPTHNKQPIAMQRYRVKERLLSLFGYMLTYF